MTGLGRYYRAMDTPDIPARDRRAALDRVATWIDRYLDDSERFPVLSPVKPGQIAAQIPDRPPEAPEPLPRILDDFERLLLPGITHWNHPGFFAYFATTGSTPGVLAESLMAALNVNAMLWKTSPAATELEQRAVDWLRQMLGLGAGWFGVINDTASVTTMLALAAAREARPELDIRRRGMAGRADLPSLRVYCSEHAHSSVDKAVITLGLGHENCVHVPGDDAFRMRPDRLDAMMAADVEAGRLPLAIVATVGTTSTGSVDPVPAIVDVAARFGAWVHVDASYAGPAAIVPECRETLAGVDRADSLVVNPHKWLFTPIDLSAFYCRRPEVLREAFSLVPSYLRTEQDGRAVNLMDYGAPLGRRFRALKLWFVMRWFGRAGVERILRSHIEWARELAAEIEADERFEVCAPVPLSLVCFRLKGSDEANRALVERVNESGEAFLAGNTLGGRFMLRLAIGHVRTAREDVWGLWGRIRELADSVS